MLGLKKNTLNKKVGYITAVMELSLLLVFYLLITGLIFKEKMLSTQKCLLNIHVSTTPTDNSSIVNYNKPPVFLD